MGVDTVDDPTDFIVVVGVVKNLQVVSGDRDFKLEHGFSSEEKSDNLPQMGIVLARVDCSEALCFVVEEDKGAKGVSVTGTALAIFEGEVNTEALLKDAGNTLRF